MTVQNTSGDRTHRKCCLGVLSTWCTRRRVTSTGDLSVGTKHESHGSSSASHTCLTCGESGCTHERNDIQVCNTTNHCSDCSVAPNQNQPAQNHNGNCHVFSSLTMFWSFLATARSFQCGTPSTDARRTSSLWEASETAFSHKTN